MSDRPFYSSRLNTQSYDLGVGRGAPADDEDVAFYRRLAAAKSRLVLRGRSHTKPGSLLKSRIPIPVR